MAEPVFLACDWGTTNLRAWTVGADGQPIEEREFDYGVGRLSPGEAEQLFHDAVRPALSAERLPAVLCGMIGSTLGWKVVDYLDCPASLDNLARGLDRVAEDVWLTPGLRGQGVAGAPDVMRGEETQILGWLNADPVRLQGEHLICHPGTHAKWAVARDGGLERFVTAMTGELFGLLTKHGVLKTDRPAELGADFDAGVEAAGDGSALASRLFTVRSRVVGGDADPAGSASYLSGLLIGAEIASTPACLNARPERVALIGEPELCVLYERALTLRGIASETFDGRDAALDGLTALYRKVRP
ncbi:2-dehydro-3-deoxygalactonokinase [Brevundimonas sp.]|uniref:2-dehydro-3-deoxygalactonokinase n=1 Tax=Brevundimonas sp. TaxID=1871086 RepID=UPI0025E47536|nr:2-dehydro-3-deoxygalactonokinase [Brevundimonas sp.]